MPGRQSHGRVLSKKPKSRTSNKKRSINAFAIAVQENPEKIRIRHHRLGESEGGKQPRKRMRDEQDKDDDTDASSLKRRKKTSGKSQFDELDVNEGSDSEGNEWQMGEIGY